MWLSVLILLEGSQIFFHLFEHNLKVEEKVQDTCCVANCFEHFARCRTLDLINEQEDQVINGTEKKHIAVKGESVSATGLDASSNEHYSSEWQYDYDEPLRDLFHHDAFVVYEKTFLGYVIAPFFLIVVYHIR